MAKTKNAPTLPLTVTEAAALWAITPGRVRQLCDQGRVKHERKGGGATRTGAILILQTERPEKLPPFALSNAKKQKSA